MTAHAPFDPTALEAQIAAINPASQEVVGNHASVFCDNVLFNETAQKVTDASNTKVTTRIAHYCVVDTASRVRVRFVNSGADGTTYGGAVAITTQRAAIELADGTLYQLTVGGLSSWSLAVGAFVESDPIHGWAPVRGDLFYSLTYVQAASASAWNATFAWPGIETSRATLTQGVATGADYTDGTGSYTTGSGFGYGPASIISDLPTAQRTIAVFGDSVTAGSEYGDPSDSTIAKPLYDAGIPYIQTTHSGASANGRNNAKMLEVIDGVSDAISALGRNDSANQTTLLALWTAVKAGGAQRVYQTTLTPKTSVSNTVPEASTATFNAWLRDGAPILAGAPTTTGSTANGVLRAGDIGHPLADYIEMGRLVEDPPDSGLWNADFYNDGTHPNSAGALRLLQTIDARFFGGHDLGVIDQMLAGVNMPPAVPATGATGYFPNRLFTSQTQLTPTVGKLYLLPYMVWNKQQTIPNKIYASKSSGSGTASVVRAGVYNSGTNGLPSTVLADFGTIDLLAGNNWTRPVQYAGAKFDPLTLYWIGICFEANSGTPMTILQGYAPTEYTAGSAWDPRSGIAYTVSAGALPTLTLGAFANHLNAAPYILWD